MLSFTLVFTSLLVVLFTYLAWQFATWYLDKRRLFKAIEGLPELEGRHWLWGHLHLFKDNGEVSLKQTRDDLEVNPRMRLMWFGPFFPFLQMHHPDTIKDVLKRSDPKQVSESGGYDVMRPWLGDGLLVSKGEKWLRNRRLLTKAFHFEALKPYTHVYSQAADILLEKWTKAMKTDPSVEITKDMTLCSLDIILRSACSTQMNVQREDHPYIKAVHEASELIAKRSGNPLVYKDWVYWLTPNGRHFKRCMEIVHGLSSQVIRERRQQLESGEMDSSGRHKDFLDVLIMARDEDGTGLTDSEIRDEVDTFLFGGHDTISTAIYWILYELASHLEIQEKCRQESKALLQERESQEFEWEDHQKLPYTTMCIKECLRLHSPISFISRELSRPLEVDGFTLPENLWVSANVYALHHNKAVWGENCMEFLPERFEHENMKSMDPFAYIPFSAGPRNCIGQVFALNEIRVIIPRILNRFYMKVDPTHKVEHQMDIGLHTKDGIKLILSPVD